MHYKTKPVEFPLSTDKEYVLVDKVIPYNVDVSFENYINELSIPFSLSEIDSDGDPWAFGCCLFTRCESEIISLFREVIRNKSDETEWNGEGLPPVGAVCEVLPPNDEWFEIEVVTLTKDKAGDDVVFYRNYNSQTSEKYYDWCYAASVKFRKPETEAERLERERLEAAIELHDIANLAYFSGCLPYNCSWEKAELETKNMWLAIVDKTGYRKGNHHE